MLKVIVELICTLENDKGFKLGEICKLTNDVFDRRNGFAYFNIDDFWQINKMELIEYKPIGKE
jgi:hypothetical protein